MDELNKFFGKPKTYVIADEEFVFHPLKGKDIDMIIGMKEGKETSGMITLVHHYLLQKYPTLTVDAVGEFSAPVLTEFVKAIFDVNGLGDGKRNT